MSFKCWLCQGEIKEQVIEIGQYTVSRCMTCGLGFLDPPLTQGSSDQLYDQGYYIKNRKVKNPEEAVNELFPRVKFVKKFRKTGALLDVGCGLGYFLAASQKMGFSVTGIEVSPWACTYVKKHFDIPVYMGTVESLDLGKEVFDVCTMWHVIEHLTDPLYVLVKLWKSLKKEGVLILETRNYQSFDARVLKDNWKGWSLPYHTWHFSSKSLKIMFEKAGYKVIKIKLTSSEYVKNKLQKIPVVKILRNPISKLFRGSNIKVIGMKCG